MKHLTIITTILFLVILSSCQKKEISSKVNLQLEPAATSYSKTEIKNIRQHLELVNLGLLSLLDNQRFMDIVKTKTLSSQNLRTIDLISAYSSITSFENALYESVLRHTNGDMKQAKQVVQSFFSFQVSGNSYYPTITPISTKGTQTEKFTPEYIVNREAPDSDVYYGYLTDGQYTYMKTEHLTTLNGWVVYETSMRKANAPLAIKQITETAR